MIKAVYSNALLIVFCALSLGMSFKSSDGIVIVVNTPKIVSYASSVVVDFSGSPELWTVLSGDITLTSSGLTPGAGVSYRIDNGTETNRYVILPSAWRKISGAVTNILSPGAIGIISAKSYAANDTNVVCTWSSE